MPRLERASTLLAHALSVASVDRLRTGPFPTAQETAPSYSCVSSLLAEGQRIDAEIQRLHILREEVNTQLRVARSMLAPVRRLPTEILSEVFTLAVCSHPPHKRAFPARDVAAVCTIWRETARATRNLWTCVDFTMATPASLEKLLNMHAELSNGLLLHVYQPPDVTASARLQHLLALPKEHTMRWGQICLHFEEAPRPPYATPDLASLVRADLVVSGDDASQALHFLYHARALQSLFLHLAPNRIPSHIFMPSLPRLTKLCLVNHHLFSSEEYIIPILQGCAASLQRLVLSHRGKRNTTNSPAGGQPILFPALLAVDLRYDAPCILPHMDTPVLETIIIRDFARPSRPICASLRHILKQSAPPIRNLKLHEVCGPAPGSEDFISCLEHLDGLTTLIVSDSLDGRPMMTWVVLARMTCSDHRQPILPALTTLSLHHGRTDHRVPEKLERVLRVMLRSRSSRRVVHGCTVEALQHVETDLKDDPIDLEGGSTDA